MFRGYPKTQFFKKFSDFLFPGCHQALPSKFLGLLLPIQPRTRAQKPAFFAFLSYLLKILKKSTD
jgi:hypothetical protein